MRQVRGVTANDTLKLLGSAFASPVTSFAKLREWQDPQLLWDINVSIPSIGQFSLRRRTDDLWHVLPWREASILALLRASLQPGDVFVDAGANIGIYTILASKLVGQSGQVIAVEMMPDTCQILVENIERNHLTNVLVLANALSNKSGETVSATVEPGKFGQATILQNGKPRGCEKIISVKTITLDEMLTNCQTVKLMKMDLEGAELAAVHGGRSSLPRIQNLIFESWGTHRNDESDVDKFLRTLGFSIDLIDGNNKLAYRDK